MIPAERQATTSTSVEAVVAAAQLLVRQLERTDLEERLNSVRHQLRSPAATCVVIGEFKQGKSSLINALLNAAVCPVDDDLATVVPTFVRHGDDVASSLFMATAERSVAPVSLRVTAEAILSGHLGEVPVSHAEICLPRKMLERGVQFVDTPGFGGLESAHGKTTLSSTSLATMVLFVTDSSQELTASEVAVLVGARRRCAQVVCVMTKTDFYPHWRKIRDRNRAYLASAAPDVSIVAVGSPLRERALADGDADMNVESGFPELTEQLQRTVLADGERQRCRSALSNVQDMFVQLETVLRAERTSLLGPEESAAVAETAQDAKRRLDELRASSSGWSTVLNDGIADLTSNVDHDLRSRTRTLIAQLEELIDAEDPADIADELLPMLEEHIMEDVTECYEHIQAGAIDIASRVAAAFDGNAVDLGLTAVEAPVGAVDSASDSLLAIDERPGLGPLIVTGLRGSYSGVAMFGMMAGFMGNAIGAVALGPAGIAAGAFFGRKLARDESERRLTQRRQQAKQGVRKYVDGVSFVVSKHSRDTLKQVQRELRDSTTIRLRELTESATAAYVAATEVAKLDAAERERRLSKVERNLADLEKLRSVAQNVDAA